MPSGTGQDLCNKCKKIIIARKVSISRRENKENKQSKQRGQNEGNYIK